MSSCNCIHGIPALDLADSQLVSIKYHLTESLESIKVEQMTVAVVASLQAGQSDHGSKSYNFDIL